MNKQIGVEITPPFEAIIKQSENYQNVNAGHIFEKSLKEIIKKTAIFDYQTSIQKRFYFDVVDVLMHITRGMASQLPANEPFFVSKSQILQASIIMNSFYKKETTINAAIETAYQSGIMFIKSRDPKMEIK